MKYLIKTVAALLVALLALAGCSGGNTSWVFRSGDIQIPAGLYIINQTNAFTNAEQKIAEENANNPEYSAPDSKQLLTMTVEGQPVADWINANAHKSIREYIAIQQKFDSMGLSLSDVELAGVESNVASIKSQSGNFYENNGISDNSIRDYYTGAAKKNRLFLTLYGEGGELEVPEDTLKAHFQEAYVMADAMPMMLPLTVPEGETRTLEELQADVRTAAVEYVELLRSGEEFEQVYYDWQLRSAEGADKEEVKKPGKGELTIIISEQNRASIGDNFTDAAFASKVNVPEIIEDNGFLILINRIDNLADPTSFENNKSALLQELKYGEFEENLTQWGADVQMETNNAAVDLYKPSRIKFDQAS